MSVPDQFKPRQQIAFEEFVTKNMGDVPVMDRGKYISPKIANYYRMWLAGINYKSTPLSKEQELEEMERFSKYICSDKERAKQYLNTLFKQG